MMIDPILALWFIAVALLGLWNAYWGVVEWQRGKAKIAFWPPMSRSSQPVSFALVIAGRLLGVVAPAVLFLIALAMTKG